MAVNKKLTLELNTIVNDKIGEALKTLAAKSSQVETKFQKTYEKTTKALEAIQKFGKTSKLDELASGIAVLNTNLELTTERAKETQKILGEQLLGTKSSEKARELAQALANITKELAHLETIEKSLKPVIAAPKLQEGMALYDNYIKSLSSKSEQERELTARATIANAVTILDIDKKLYQKRKAELAIALQEHEQLLQAQLAKEQNLAAKIKAAYLGGDPTQTANVYRPQPRRDVPLVPETYLQGTAPKSIVTAVIDTKALSKLQATYAQEQALAKEHASTLIGIQLRRDIAIKNIADAHNAKMSALQIEVDSAIARRHSQAKHDELAARIRLEVETADKEIRLIREVADKKIQTNQNISEKFNTYYKNLEVKTQAHVEETLAIYRSGHASLEAERVRWANKERQITQKLQEDLKKVREAESSGAITSSLAGNRIRQLQKDYRDEVEAGRKGLIDKERIFQQEESSYTAHLGRLEARTKYHLSRTEAIIKYGQDSIQAKEIAYQEAQRNLAAIHQKRLEAVELKRTRGLSVAEAKQETATLTAEYNAQVQALLRRFTQVQESNARTEEEHRRHLHNLQQTTQANLAEEHAIHIHGDAAIEVERIRSAERQRQIQETLQRTLADIDRRRQVGGISNTAAIAESTQAYNTYSAAISATTRQLHALEQAATRAAQHHRNLFLRVGEIISAYTIWNAVRTNLWAGLQAVPNIGMALETTKSVLQTTMGGFSGAQVALKLLSEEADRTGINLNALREIWRNFSASTTIAGETVQTTWNIFKNFNTVVTSLHLSTDKATGIFNALAQIFNKSKVQSEELVKQLGNLLPGAFAAFAKANNYATSELIKKMKAGEVFAHDTIEKFAKFYASTFTESFDLASNSLQANVGRMQNAWTELAETLYSQTSGSLVATVRGLTEIGKWLKEDAEGANIFGKSIEVGMALAIGALGSLALGTQTVRNAVLAVTTAVGLMGTAIRATAVSSNIAMATMTVTANTLGAALKAAFMSNWLTLLIGGIAYAGIKLYELNQEAKSFQEQVEASVKAAEKRRQVAAGTYTPEQEQEDTFKTKLEDDPELQGYIKLLEELKKKKEEIGKITPAGSGRQSADAIRARKELEELARQELATEFNIAEKKKEIRREVDQVYIDQTKDTDTIVKRLYIERLQNEGKLLEAAKEQYQLNKKEEIATLNDTIDKLEEREEDHLKRLQKLRAIYKEDPTESNKGNIALQEQLLAQNLEEQRKNKQAILDYVISLDEAGKKKLLENETKFSNDRLSILKNQYKDAERLQKQHYETIKANLEAQQDELRFIQSIKGEALPELESIKKQELLIQEKIAAAYADQEKRIQNIIQGQKTLNEITTTDFGLIPSEADTAEFEQLLAKYESILHDSGKALSAATTEFKKLHPETNVSIEQPATPQNLPRADIQENIFTTNEAAVREETARTIRQLESEQLDLGRQRKQAIIALLDSTKDLQIQEAETRGELVKAGELRAEQQYAEEERLLNLIVTSEEYTDTQKEQAKLQIQIINFLKEREKVQNKLVELQVSQNSNDELLSLREQAIARSEARGNLTPMSSMFARASSAREALASNNYEEQINLLQNKFDTAGPNEKGGIAVELEQAKAAYDELKLKGEEVGNYFQNEIANMLVSPLTDFINGQKTAMESMKAFGFAFAEMIQKMIIQELAYLAVKMLFRAAGFASGGDIFARAGGSTSTSSQPTPSNLSGQFSSFIPSRATGGPLTNKVINLQEYKRIKFGKIEGEGTETSDSIKALAPEGSYVLKASSAKKIGYAKLQELIKGKLTNSDKLLPVNVSRNEALIPPDTVQRYGLGFFDRLNKTGEMRAEGGSIGRMPNTNIQTTSPQVPASNVTLIVHVNHTGSEKPEDLGEKIGIAAVKKIASQEASKQIYLYDKNKSVARSRSS